MKAGFPAIWASSFEIATSNMQADDTTLSRRCVSDRVRAICERLDVPVLIDAETGFPHEGGLSLTVRSFERTGAAGMCLEDKAHPKRNTLLPGSHALLASETFAINIASAVKARVRESFLILARTEALSVEEPLDCIRKRILAYAAAGCDAVVIHVRARDLPRIPTVLESLTPCVPVGLIMADSPPLRIGDVDGLDVSFCIFPHVGLRATMPALARAYEQVLRAPSALESDYAFTPTVGDIDAFVQQRSKPHLGKDSELPLESCPYNVRCLNFRRDGATYCAVCDSAICDDHFHDSERALRLCKSCFIRNINSLDDLPSTALRPLNEPEVCYNSVFCYTFGKYTLLMEKACSGCGKTPLPKHYHNIIENKRYCYSCISKVLRNHG